MGGTCQYAGTRLPTCWLKGLDGLLDGSSHAPEATSLGQQFPTSPCEVLPDLVKLDVKILFVGADFAGRPPLS